MEIIETNLSFNSNMTERKTTKRGIFHNSGTAVRQAIDIIHNYHKNTRGYAGIGYHFYIRKDGTIYKGRDLAYAGAHCPGINSISIGICAEGDFSKETMSEIQKNAIIELIKYLGTKYNIKWIKGHGEVVATSCPGTNFPLEEIKNIISNTLVPELQCDAHIEDIGWVGYKDTSKQIIGTQGQGKRLEAIRFKTNNGLQIEYRVHIENIGWQEWKKNEEVAGTTGQSLRIEAIEIKCNKELEVQEHIEEVGWMPSSKGTNIRIGTEGKALRLEAFKIGIL